MPTFKVTPEIQREINNYRQFMQDNEYSVGTAFGYSTYLSRFLRLVPQDKADSLQKRIAGFLEEQRESSPQVYKECRAALFLYFKMVIGENYPKKPLIIRNPDIEAILKDFQDYSINIKRVQPSTALAEASHIRKFLEHVETDKISRLEDITAYEVRDYVIDCLSHLSDSSKGITVTAIRNFFRHQKFEGVPIHNSVFTLPLSPAVWRNSAFPITMDESTFSSLESVPDQQTVTGKRDRCIILCFTELALRCGEVASLTLDDFNWHGGYVSIKNTKNRSDRKLPVSDKLGQSVTEYLQASRPQTACRTLFVRFKHTCGEPMGTSQIRGVVRRVYGKTGEDIAATGTHILRRTAGTIIYNSGNSLKMTADILGHESLDSTVFYTKADIAGLRQVAAPWSVLTEKVGDHNA